MGERRSAKNRVGDEPALVLAVSAKIAAWQSRWDANSIGS